MSSGVVVIVDAFSASSQFIPECLGRGLPVLHLQSREDVPESIYQAFPRETFVRNVIHQGDLAQTAALLREYSPAAIIAGHERSVELADTLSERLGCPTNGTRMSRARRNKYFMGEAVRASGARAPLQIKSADIETILEWHREHRLPEVVVKPLNSSGTDHVFYCKTEAEVRERFREILGKKNHLGFVNEEVLVQERIKGVEYIVNTVSCRGEPVVTEIWKYNKRHLAGAATIYDWDELLDGDQEEAVVLTGYTLKVLKALEIGYGPMHTEIMIDERGPVLIECGARVDGMTNTALNKECVGFGQVDLTIDSYLEPEKTLSRKLVYKLKKHASNVSLINSSDGTVESFAKFEEIRKLPSFIDLKLRVFVGSHLRRTVNYPSSPGLVFLAHEDRNVIARDYQRIRELEDQGLFR